MDKTIKVNPELFRISTPKKSKRNKTAKRGQSIRKNHKKLEKNTNTLKKALIKKIQAHQERQRLHIEREQLRMKKENERLKEKLKTQERPASSFEYLKKLQESVKERKQRRQEKHREKKEKEMPKHEVKPYLQDFLKKKERIVPKKIEPISLGKQTSQTPQTLQIPQTLQTLQTVDTPTSASTITPTSPKPEPSTPIVLKEPPPYGILKGGSKPLYSSYRKTRKQHERLQTIQQRSRNHTLSETHEPIHVKSNVTIEPNAQLSTQSSTQPNLESRRNKLLQIKNLFKESKTEKETESSNTPNTPNTHTEQLETHEQPKQSEQSEQPNLTTLTKPTEQSIDILTPSIDTPNTPNTPNTPKIPMPSLKSFESFQSSRSSHHTPSTGKVRKRIRRTTRRKYQVGKLKTPNGTKVHLLVKNRNTRKKQLMESKEIKKIPILEVRKYLRERNLIRVGSQAPEYVLRQLYESSRFSGDVENKSSDVLLHNYMNTDGQTDCDLEPVPQAEMNYDVDTFLRELNGETSTPGLGDTSALDAMLVNRP